MTEVPGGDPLRARFEELRAETEGSGRLPDFATMLERARADAATPPTLEIAAAPMPSRWVRRGLWASAAMAATVAALLLTDGGGSDEEEFARLVEAYASDASAGAWRSPTSELLEVPGMDLVRSVPSIGDPVRGVDPASLPVPSAPEENS